MKRTIAILAFLLVPSAVFAQAAIIVVRHAERADAGMASGTKDPELSEAGRARAAALAAILKDARINRIYVTEFKRTRQTAEPLATLLRVDPVVVPSQDTPALVAQLKAASGNVLVVGHSNTVPAIIKGLGGEAIEIGDAEYDNLLVVTLGAAPSLLRLRYR